MVEAGEGRTPLSNTKTVYNNTLNSPYPSTSSVLASNFQPICDRTNFESDSTKLLLQFLDRLVALGQTAQQLNLALGRNGHQPEAVKKLIEEITNG